MSTTPDAAPPPTPFHDLDAFIGLPRTDGLALSPDGTRLVTAVATLNPKRTAHVTALWEVDPTGARAPRRLTRSAKGEASPAFLPNGDLLFTSARPDPDGDAEDDAPAMLWLLPAGGGEARVIAERPGGITGPVVARDQGTLVVSSATFPSSTDAETEQRTRTDRKDRKVSAILHTAYPVRHWDHDLGPDAPRLFVAETDALTRPDDANEASRLTLRDLTPDAGAALVEASYDVTPDGTTVITDWIVNERAAPRVTLVAIDVASGERRTIATDDDVEFHGPVISPDGTTVAAMRSTITTPTDPPENHLVLVSIADGSRRELAPGWDRWATQWRWLPDGSALLATADDDGRGPVFRLDVATGTVTILTSGDTTHTNLAVSPDGDHLYALATSYQHPPRPVRLDPGTTDQRTTPLRAPAPSPELPGRLTEVSTTAEDGATVRAWLALPDGASAERPAPLALWVHGGPLGSWNAWSWRWCPWLLVAKGYAVLLPDPALSTGYGRDFVRRGWGRWGEAPFTDLMAITDAAVARDDIDGDRTAAMGGSFGGYMANWIAGHTDRFRAIVSHASLWALDQFGGTTDGAYYWAREMTVEMMEANSPHASVDAITTPMLIVHGDKDYRVPIGEALRLWWDLTSRVGDGDDPGHRFLYFPDEHHWILSPQHAIVWYETVFAFLAHHVLGEKWETPELLD